MYQQCLILLMFSLTINSFAQPTAIKSKSDEKFVNKCCDTDQLLGQKKTCVKHNGKISFSQMKVYVNYIYDSGNYVEDVFRIKPNKFYNNATFKNKSINVHTLYEGKRVAENGHLILESPNAYDRFTLVAVDDYCIDYRNISGKIVLEYRVVLPENEPGDQAIQDGFAHVAMSISCFFMMLVLLVFSLLKRLRNLSGLVLMSYVSSLFMAFMLLIFFQINGHYGTSCLMFTLGVYYFFMASFCWMTVMSFDIWGVVRHPQMSTFVRKNKKLSRFLKYCVYAWGVPLMLTIFLAVVNSVDMRDYPWFVTPGIPDKGCFLLGGVKLLYLYIPMLILNLCNWMFFIMTVLGFLCHNLRTNVLDTAAAGKQQEHRKLKNKLILYFKLYVVMGLNWVLEIISFVYPKADSLWKITDFYNILVGVSIFIIFVCKRKVLEELQRFLGAKFRDWHSSFRNMRSKEGNPSGVSMTVRPSPSQTSQPNGYRPVSTTAF